MTTAPPDRKTAKSRATQLALMQATEKLAAKKGIQNVSIKEIVKTAGQKNESALQYHFKNFQGLIEAIKQNRNDEVRGKRAELLTALQTESHPPSLRDLCGLMVLPTFLLARESPDFRRYILSFSHELAFTKDSALAAISRLGGGGESGYRTGDLLRAALPHLDETAYRDRMELAVRLSSVALGHHARSKNAFRGQHSDLFISNLIDAIEGLLAAPISEETRQLQNL